MVVMNMINRMRNRRPAWKNEPSLKIKLCPPGLVAFSEDNLRAGFFQYDWC